MIQKVLDIQQATERGGANADGGVLQTSLAASKGYTAQYIGDHQNPLESCSKQHTPVHARAQPMRQN